ncbi:MAG: DUF4275 family protein [Clostridia bacterium]|nr:DUF4275 family protein [Clostridia bacterium]
MGRRKIARIPRESLERRWLTVFGAGVPKKKLRRYVEDQYIWHVFSWELLPEGSYLTGSDAQAAFSRVNKAQAFCIQPFEEAHVRPLPEAFTDPMAIDAQCVELYVVASDFTWTYIKTHEGSLCGPYFMWCGGRRDSAP